MGFVVSSWWGSLGFATIVAVEITIVGFHEGVAVEIIVLQLTVWCTELHSCAIDGENKEPVVSLPLVFYFSMLSGVSLMTSGSSKIDTM